MELYRDILSSNSLTVWLDISTYCNAACPQCHRTNPNGLGKTYWLPLTQWSIESFKKSFPLSSLQYIEKFDICGTWGDPLMNKDIDLIVKYIVSNSMADILIHTNGSLRDEDFWWDLGVIGGRRLTVQFTVDGTTEEQHTKYRQKTSLQKTLDNMLALASTKSTVGVYCVVFEHNEQNLLDIAKLCQIVGASYITFVPSNRFHQDLKWYDTFHFIDEDGNNSTLQRSKIKNSFTVSLNNLTQETFLNAL